MTLDDLLARPIHPSEPEPRIESRPMTELRAAWADTLARIPGDGLKGDGFPRNVLGVLMHNPDTLGPFLEYWVTSKSRLNFSVREQELVILRMGVLYRSNYVFKHHVKVGREFGIDDRELAAIRVGNTSVFGAREAALLELTDELVDLRTVRASTWGRLGAWVRPVELVDLIALVSQYVLFALTNNAAQVQIEDALDAVPGIVA